MDITSSENLDISFLRFLLSKTQDEEIHRLVKQMGELAASRLAVYSMGRACLESKVAPPPLSAVFEALRRVLLELKRPGPKPASTRTGKKPITTKAVPFVARESASIGLSRLTDEEVRRQLFQQLLERLEAERANDQTVMVLNRTPFTFSLSRHGNLLTVHQRRDERLMQLALTPRQGRATHEDNAPWNATVRRTPDRARLALSGGPEGTVNEIVGSIVETFLRRTQ
jgi:hypothetical protein